MLATLVIYPLFGSAQDWFGVSLWSPLYCTLCTDMPSALRNAHCALFLARQVSPLHLSHSRLQGLRAAETGRAMAVSRMRVFPDVGASLLSLCLNVLKAG